MTWSEFKSGIRQTLFPAGESSNLVVAHDKFFVDAIIDLQTWVQCLKQDNTDLFPQCSTLYDCGLTVFQAPRGNIFKLSVIDKAHALPSGTVTASKTGINVIASAPFFDSSMTGNLIKFGDGQTFRIQQVIDSQHLIVADTQAQSSELLIDGGTPAGP